MNKSTSEINYGIGVGLETDILESEEIVVGLEEEKIKFGPIPKESPEKLNNVKKDPVIGLSLSPGGYNTISHLVLLKALMDEGIKVHMIAASGMASVAGVIYSTGLKNKHFVWNYYKLIKKLETHSYLSNGWSKELLRFLDKEVANPKLEKLSIPLFIPYIDSNNNKVEVKLSGELSQEILKTINPVYEKGVFPVQSKQVFFENLLKKHGADIVLSFDVMGNNIKIKNNYSYLYGYFKLIHSNTKREKVDLEHYFDISLLNSTLDSPEGISYYIKEQEKLSSSLVLKIKEIIKEWKKDKGEI